MPLPGSRVVHPAWQAHHRPVSDAAMASTCQVHRPTSTSTWDDTAGRSVAATPTLVYPTGAEDGRCRISRQMPLRLTPTVGDRTTTLSEYVVALPADAPQVRVGDLVTVASNPDDPALAGQVLRVKDPRTSSHTWERLLLCELQPPTSR